MMNDPSFRVAARVISRYRRILGVPPIRRITRDVFYSRRYSIADDLYEHPTFRGLGFTLKGRVFYSCAFALVATNLPHEITHAAWPRLPEEIGGPEDEWTCGMIPFELAWLNILCTRPSEKRWLPKWTRYAEEGKPEDAEDVQGCTEEAKRMVRAFKLPDPWAITEQPQ